jgi:hypothetical protein
MLNREISERPILSTLSFFLRPNHYRVRTVSVAAVVDDLGRTVSLVKVQVHHICHNIGDTANWRTEERRLRLINKGQKVLK